MDLQGQRDLLLLSELDRNGGATQRTLASKLGVALGLTNLYLKRLARKGSIKIVEFPRKPAARKRLRYLLTPTGMAEKTRLTYEHMTYSLNLYRRARQTLRDSLGQLPERGIKRIALFGTGEPAELAYLTLRELGLEPLGVFAREAGGAFLGFPVRALAELPAEEPDAVVVATFERPEPALAELLDLGLVRERIVTLRKPMPAPTTRLRRDPAPAASASRRRAS